MPFIEQRTGPRAGFFTEIRGDHFFIGRDVTVDLRIDDGRASRRHCEIFRQGAAWRVRDLGSSNGTMVNGTRAGEQELSDGDEICIGAMVLVYRETPPTGSRRLTPQSAQAPAAEPPRMDTLVAERATLIQPGGKGASERAMADLRSLFAVARACTQARTPEQVLAALGRSLAERLQADRVFVFLGSGDKSVAWSASDGSFAADPDKVPASHTVVERARAENLSVLMTDPGSDPELAAARSIEINRICTALAAPLSSGGRAVGVLYADRLGRAVPFGPEDLELAGAAALLAAGALSGASELARARAEIGRLSGELGAGEMLGQSPAMKEVRRLIAQAGPTDAAVLVTGESGTGKELVARAIHAASRRASEAFEVVNCAALAESLIESELFGHAKGAFTGAAGERVGRFELADGGTLFLDEIGELSAGAQAKLLRVLEQGELSRVGESQVRRVDVRVIAATNRDLEAEVRDKKFRQDLYYRLNVLRIALPPLAERGGDVGLLLDHFLAAAARRLGRPALVLEPEAREKLLAYLWPGNVRELRNLVERLAILSATGRIATEDLPAEVGGGGQGGGASPAAASGGPAAGGARKLDDLVREHILTVLAASGGNKSKAAETLGIDRSTLYARLKEYGQG
ncbi:MAG TPA: sigma 54-interacting transcriptional regulator [Planctomycetota bacterium]|nr:sigma 54-interacting transcriptional regulator [Planctomycetota bacterium]